ncbi:hypothetical protein B0H10DRAFT_2131522 [Mycena sp. CBHHK59/15]|nr:hypothetical protein B0H10DRAFT_2131522 [Mycena sp. CBHHK59/15]
MYPQPSLLMGLVDFGLTKPITLLPWTFRESVSWQITLKCDEERDYPASFFKIP